MDFRICFRKRASGTRHHGSATHSENEGSLLEVYCKNCHKCRVFTIVTLFGYYLGSYVDTISPWVDASQHVGQTVAFLILAYSSILHVFNVRSSQSIFKVNLATNKALVEMALLALAITTAVALLPFTQELFGLVHISLNHWFLVGILSIVPIAVNELIKFHRLPEAEEEE